MAHRALFAWLGDARFWAFCPLVSAIVRGFLSVLLSVLTVLANSKSGERYHNKGHFSLLGGEYQPPLVLEKNRTSLRKSTSPPVSRVNMSRLKFVFTIWRQAELFLPTLDVIYHLGAWETLTVQTSTIDDRSISPAIIHIAGGDASKTPSPLLP